MNPAILSAVAALIGSLIGASGSVLTTWIVQRAQYITQQRLAGRARREALFSEFIVEASKRYGEAMLAERPEIDHIGALYSLVSRVRLFASEKTIEAAETVMRRLIDIYYAPPMTPDQLHEATASPDGDPLRDFSKHAREELLQVG